MKGFKRQVNCIQAGVGVGWGGGEKLDFLAQGSFTLLKAVQTKEIISAV